MQDKKLYISKNFKEIKHIFDYLKRRDAKYFISSDEFFNYSSNEFENYYYNNCGQLKVWKYPIYSIVIDDRKKDSFLFLKTEDGYRLMNISLDIK